MSDPCRAPGLARRAARMNPSVIREILKLTERPGMISLAGGLPSPDTFPVEAMRAAADRVLRDAPHAALQYAASEGHRAAARMGARSTWPAQGLAVDAAQVLITTGSQQGLDLVGKVLIDAGERVAVESPTYLGALQAFAPYEPEFVAVDCDDEGPLPEGWPQPKARVSSTCCPISRIRAGAASGRSAASPWSRPPRRAGCRWSRTTRTAICGSTRPRRRRWRRSGQRARSISARSRRCWRRACAWATWWRRRRCMPSCCRPSRLRTCTRPGSTSAWFTKSSATASWRSTCRRSAPATRRSATRWARRCAPPRRRRMPLERAAGRHVLLARTA